MSPQSTAVEFSVEDRLIEWSVRVQAFLKKYYQHGIRAASKWRVLQQGGDRLFGELKAELAKTAVDYLPETRKALNE